MLKANLFCRGKGAFLHDSHPIIPRSNSRNALFSGKEIHLFLTAWGSFG